MSEAPTPCGCAACKVRETLGIDGGNLDSTSGDIALAALVEVIGCLLAHADERIVGLTIRGVLKIRDEAVLAMRRGDEPSGLATMKVAGRG